MEAGQHSPDSSSEECTVLEAPPPKNTCLQHAAKVCVRDIVGGGGGQTRAWIWFLPRLRSPTCTAPPVPVRCVRTVFRTTRTTPR